MKQCHPLLLCIFLLMNQSAASGQEQWLLQLRWIRVAVHDRTLWTFIANQTTPLSPVGVPGHLFFSSLSEESVHPFGSLDLMIRYQFDRAPTMSQIIRTYNLKAFATDGSGKINKLKLEILHTECNNKEKKLFDHLILPRDFPKSAVYGWWMEISLGLAKRNSDIRF